MHGKKLPRWLNDEGSEKEVPLRIRLRSTIHVQGSDSSEQLSQDLTACALGDRIHKSDASIKVLVAHQ